MVREGILALVDVVSWDSGSDQVAWKFPSTNLRLGTQLVVRPGQVAIFVYRGRICDEITEGTITLTTGNIPLLTTLLSLPFGGNTPFQAEVWFINKLIKLDTKWGTPTPIQIEDPKYGIIVPIRAHGQYGFRVLEPRAFLTTLLGAQAELSDDRIRQYFRGKVLSTVGSQLGSLFNSNLSIFNMAAHLDELSNAALERIAPSMRPFGIDLVTFYFESINVPEDDPSYAKLRAIKEKSAELNIVGRDIYQLDKSMDVLKTAASNEGLAGMFMQSGIGGAMGLAIGAQLGQQAASLATTVPPAPPAPPAFEFYIAINGQQAGPFPMSVLQQMATVGTFTAATLVWQPGFTGWQPAASVQALAALFAPPAPAQTSSPPIV